MICTPTLGYPSRKDAVVALTMQGFTRDQISAEIGIHPTTVGVYQHKARHPRVFNPRMKMPDAIAVALDSHAAKRGVSVPEIALEILQAVVDGGLVDAVLDDGEP